MNWSLFPFFIFGTIFKTSPLRHSLFHKQSDNYRGIFNANIGFSQRIWINDRFWLYTEPSIFEEQRHEYSILRNWNGGLGARRLHSKTPNSYLSRCQCACHSPWCCIGRDHAFLYGSQTGSGIPSPGLQTQKSTSLYILRSYWAMKLTSTDDPEKCIGPSSPRWDGTMARFLYLLA